MYCRKCGNEVHDGAKFCNKCGAQVEQKIKDGGINLPSNISKKNIMITLIVVCVVFVVGFIGIGLRSDNNEMGSLENTQTDQDLYDTEEESVSLTSTFAEAKQGNVLTFGNYEQDNNLNNGKEAIEWIVLKNEGDKILVLSKYVLDLQMYHKVRYTPMTWEQSDMRKWLNEEFLSNAFSEEEKDYIVVSHITTPNTNMVQKGRNNQQWETYGGNDTTDQMFLLSIQEVESYAFAYCCAQGTTYALNCYEILSEEYEKDYWETFSADYVLTCNTETGNMAWATRSPGTPMEWEDDYSVKTIDDSDSFIFVEPHGDFHTGGHYRNYVGVRPAMWIEIRK